MRLKAILFDVDGTIADTERDGHRVAFNRAFSDFGLDWHWDIERYGKLLQINGGKERIHYYIDHLASQNVAIHAINPLVDALYAAKTNHYIKALASEAPAIPLRPGVYRIIREAQSNGLKLAIATSSTFENVAALLKTRLAEDALDWFDVIATSDNISRKKPASDIYQYVLKNLKLPANECIAIEDSEYGLISSLGANLKTVVTVNDYTKTESFNGALAVVSNLGEPHAPYEVFFGETFGRHFIEVDLLEIWAQQ
jgi:HAD superfamily hydrolase (TIGR01509 family)